MISINFRTSNAYVPFPTSTGLPSSANELFGEKKPCDGRAVPLREQLWFHGHVRRVEAQLLLRRDGDFLIRESLSQPGRFVLSGMWASEPLHFEINEDCADGDKLYHSSNGIGSGGQNLKEADVELDATYAFCAPSDTPDGESQRAREERTFTEFSTATPYIATIEEAQEKVALLKSKRAEMVNWLKELDRRIASRATPGAATTGAATTGALPAHHGIRLQKLELIKFDGNPLHFNRWWSQFSKGVHERPEIDAVEKFCHLMGSVTGKAEKAIAGFTDFTDVNYDAAIVTLQRRFGQKGPLIDTLHDQLAQLKCGSGPTAFTAYVEEIESACRQLEGLGEDVANKQVERAIMRSLPDFARSKIIEVKHGVDDWNTELLREKLIELAECREEYFRGVKDPSEQKKPASTKDHRSSPKSRQPKEDPLSSSIALATTDQTRSACYFCDGDHLNRDCPKFSTPEQRFNEAKAQHRCFICLGKAHSSKECWSKRVCNNCGRRHHTLLCREGAGQDEPEEPAPLSSKSRPKRKAATQKQAPTTTASKAVTTTPPSKANTTTNLVSAPTLSEVAAATTTPPRTVMLAAAKVKICNPARPQQLFEVCLALDSFSHRSFINRKVFDRLELESHGVSKSPMSGLNGTALEAEERPRTRIALRLKDKAMKLVEADVVPKITNPIPTILVDNGDKCPSFASLGTVVEVSAEEARRIEPDVLIGGDYFWQFPLPTPHKLLPNGLRIIDTIIGDIVVSGGDEAAKPEEEPVVSMVVTEGSDSNIPVSSIWELDSIGITDDPYEDEEQRAIELFEEAVTRDEEGRYWTRLPWKTDKLNFPTNWNRAKRRCDSQLVSLQKNPNEVIAYHQVILDYYSKGMLAKVDLTQPPNGIVRYLSHFAVKNDSTTTPVRIVFDSAEIDEPTQQSFNDYIYPGPSILPSLAGIVMRYRAMDIVLSADVEKAFLQVGLDPRDQDACRFIWVKDPQGSLTWDNMEVYRWTRIAFGLNASPFLLAATTHTHLKQFELGPELLRNLYVDNLIIGCKTPEEALRKYGESTTIFRQAKMNLRKFVCSDLDTFNKIPKESRSKDVKQKVLGLRWDLSRDTLHIPLPTAPVDKITKRTVLAAINSLYDPLGYATPLMVDAKIFVQDLWKKEVQWDQQLDEDDCRRWKTIISAWNTAEIWTPRRLIPHQSEDTTYELHVCCDASKKAYGCNVYLVSVNGRKRDCRLVFARSRIRPMKKKPKASKSPKTKQTGDNDGIGTPRLELMATTIGARAAKFVEQELDLKIERRVMWTDSTCVLGWLHTEKKLKKFVQNRVNEIKAADFDVRHVPGDQNPADITSRGASATDLQQSQLWWEGPEWFKQREASWPKQMKYKEVDIEVELMTVEPKVEVLQSFFTDSDIDRIGSYNRLLRISAYALRFIHKLIKKRNARGRAPKLPVRLNNPTLRKAANVAARAATGRILRRVELEAAESLLIKAAQVAYPPQSKRNDDLELYRDYLGLTRCKGRLGNSELKAEARHPILIPRQSAIAKLLIQAVHNSLNHAGTNQTLTHLRRGYWIPRGRATVDQVRRKCRGCMRERTKPFALPPMGDLPAERVNRGAVAWTNVGVDYMGPVTIKDKGQELKKHYVALFTCMTSRSVHLETVPDQSTLHFINALRRMSSHKGRPSVIWSDNATTFRAANEVEQLIWADRVKDEDLIAYLENGKIDWRFIVEYAPWQGGFYEIMVKLTKVNLRRAIGRNRLSYEDFRTFTAEIAGILNSRPLTYAPAEFNCPFYSPLDLYQRTNRVGFPVLEEDWGDEAYLPPDLTSHERIVDEVRKTTRCIDKYWEHWATDYLTSLREHHQKLHRSKGREAEPKVDELVLLYDEALPRGHWKLSRVEQINRGHDGYVRSAVVRMPTSGRRLKRPVNHLYSLEIDGAPPAAAPVTTAQAELNEPADQQAMPALEELEMRSCAASSIAGPKKWPFFLLLICVLSGAAHGEMRRGGEMPSPYRDWKVVGIELGQAVVPTAHEHRVAYVDLDFSDGFDSLDPEAWRKWESELCRTLPDAWNCTETGKHSRKRRFIGEAALGVGIAAHVRITLLKRDLANLGTLVSDSLTEMQKRQRMDKIMVQLSSIAEEWRVISRTGRAPDQFWDPATIKRILEKLEVTDQRCYRAPRVFESLTTIRIVRHHAFPRLRVEIRLNLVESCGRLLKGVRHIGEPQGPYFGWKTMPDRAIVSDRKLTGLSQGDCRLVRLNTYHCSRPNGQEAFKDDRCVGPPTANNATVAMTTVDRGCTWQWVDTRTARPCFTNIIRDDDRELIYVATGCQNYTITSPTNTPRTYKVEGLTQLVVKLVTDQVLTVGNVTTRSKGAVHGRMERIMVLAEDDPAKWDQAASRLRGWVEERGHSFIDDIPLPPAHWLVAIAGAAALIVIGPLAWCVYSRCCRTNPATTDVAVHYHAPPSNGDGERAVNFLRADQLATPRIPQRRRPPSNRFHSTPIAFETHSP